jgi:hypothetical protein
MNTEDFVFKKMLEHRRAYKRYGCFSLWPGGIFWKNPLNDRWYKTNLSFDAYTRGETMKFLIGDKEINLPLT